MKITFEFVEFKPSRKMRGSEAARFRVFVDGELDAVLWMSVKDIKNNCEALRQGLKAYGVKS